MRRRAETTITKKPGKGSYKTMAGNNGEEVPAQRRKTRTFGGGERSFFTLSKTEKRAKNFFFFLSFGLRGDKQGTRGCFLGVSPSLL